MLLDSMFLDMKPLRFRRQNALLEKWYSGEPIWLTNQKAGGFSGSMYFPAGDATIFGKTATNFRTWTTNGDLKEWTRDFDDLLDWFTRPQEPINLGLFYVADPDASQHFSGTLDTNSERTWKVLKELDKLVS